MKTKMVNWSIKLGLVGLTTVATTLAIVGCDVDEVNKIEASVDSNFTVVENVFNIDHKVAIEIVDEDTGVHYLILYNTYSHKSGIAITPLYNADGTLKVD